MDRVSIKEAFLDDLAVLDSVKRHFVHGDAVAAFRLRHIHRFARDGSLQGEIFDGTGMVTSGRVNGIENAGKRVLVVGCGGAGRAIAFALAADGVARLGLSNRTPARAQSLAGEVRAAFPGIDVSVAAADARGWEVIVNATSLGLHEGDPMPLDPATLTRGMALIDIIAPRDTEIMSAARQIGCKVIGGRPMIECQFEDQVRFLGLESAP